MGREYLKAGTLLAPLPPALVSVGIGERANLITIGWTGILATTPTTTYVSVRESRHSYKILKEHGEFVIHLCSADMAPAVDYAGIYTGAKVDKWRELGLTKEESRHVSVPTVAEAPIAIECRVREVLPMGSHDVFVADVLGVSVKAELLDREGKLHMERAGLLAYMHGEYYTLGERVGRFGYSATPAARGGVKGKVAVGATDQGATESTPKGYQRRGIKPQKKKKTVKPPPFETPKKRR